MKRRQKGQGRLFARGGVWYLRTRANGRESARSLGARSRAEAERMVADEMQIAALRSKVARLESLKAMIGGVKGEIGDRMRGVRAIPLGGLAEAFLHSPRRPDCGAGTLAMYRVAADRLAAFLGRERDSRTVGPADAEAYARHLGEGLAANTYNKHVNALSAVWRVLAPSMGLDADANPWAGIARRKLRPHVRRALTAAEVDRLMGAADGELRTLIAIGAYTGLRLGDACRLRWEDVQGGTVRVSTSKTGARVAIPVHPRLAEALGDRRGGKGHVMPGLAERHGRDPSGVSKAVMRAFRAAGIVGESVREGRKATTDCSFHSLRHTFVTRAIEAGVPQAMVQALVGHSSAAMTERYTHIGDAAMLDAFRRM